MTPHADQRPHVRRPHVRRPHVMLSAAVSIDGFLDDTSDERLVLSDAPDLAEISRLRAEAAAILVGANTIRTDSPKLLSSLGATFSPIKVTLTRSVDLDPLANFFVTGDCEKIVYCPKSEAPRATDRLGDRATIVPFSGDSLEITGLLHDLAGRGITKLMVEGGETVFRQFFAADAVDELRLAVAPLVLGQAGAPRFVGAEGLSNHFQLARLQTVGTMAVMHYTRAGSIAC